MLNNLIYLKIFVSLQGLLVNAVNFSEPKHADYAVMCYTVQISDWEDVTQFQIRKKKMLPYLDISFQMFSKPAYWHFWSIKPTKVDTNRCM